MKTFQNILIGARRTVNPKDVILLTADENYTQIYFSNGVKVTVATTLKILEKRFSNSDFFRTHKSYLINLNYIKSSDLITDKGFIQMANGYRVMISRRKKRAFQAKISTISETIHTI